MKELHIALKEESEDSLAMFPLRDGQYFEPTETATVQTLIMGEYKDTTVAQEQFLNMNPAVLGYIIVSYH